MYCYISIIRIFQQILIMTIMIVPTIYAYELSIKQRQQNKPDKGTYKHSIRETETQTLNLETHKQREKES